MIPCNTHPVSLGSHERENLRPGSDQDAKGGCFNLCARRRLLCALRAQTRSASARPGPEAQGRILVGLEHSELMRYAAQQT